MGFTAGRLRGFLFQADDTGEETLIVPSARQTPPNHSRVINAEISDRNADIDLRESTWLKHPLMGAPPSSHDNEIRDVLQSWHGTFSYLEEDTVQGVMGLRAPQLGALHAVHAHWSVSDAPATVVMPTGTGKTETMLSLLVSARCFRLLVVVPTDVLRTQIFEKFVTLGILREPGCSVLSPPAKHPIVGLLKHIPRSVDDVDEFFGRCHVIVTTSVIAGRSSGEVQDRMAHHCPYLFIDEAHHAEAPTWRGFRDRFKHRRIVQFTATPFREDGKRLDGKFVYTYPLRKAQEEGYFKPIRFQRVLEFNKKNSDAAIAEVAIRQLRADAAAGHILMARVGSVARARDVFKIYERYEEFKPVQLHTGITSIREREAARQQILSGESRIVVCVDMLGEGFDLPQLKIAAFHDIRKSLAVTLQLAGRFTRSRSDLGDATFIANTADVDVQEELSLLYARDPDWNVLLPQLTDQIIGEQISLQEFLEGFTDPPAEIPLRDIRPALSTVAYNTTCTNWNPHNFRAGIPQIATCPSVYHTVNEADHTLIIVTARPASPVWTDVEHVSAWDWELYVVIWSPEHSLLFIHGSTKAGVYRPLAEAVVGPDATLINGQQVFRAFAGVTRLRLQNVGLSEQLGRNIRYIGRMGANVESGLSGTQRGRGRKSVLAGTGFENGRRVTIGASRRGRIWSHQRDRVDRLRLWCREIGAKLLNSEIDPNDVLAGTLQPMSISTRPAKLPISVDWPEEMYRTRESIWSITVDGHEEPVSDLDLSLVDPDVAGPLRFAIESETARVEVVLELFRTTEGSDYRFSVDGNHDIGILNKHTETSLSEFFYATPPIIWFADGSTLDGNELTELRNPPVPYNTEKIHAWTWDDVNIKKESQGTRKDEDSIQARVIRELRQQDYDVIVDDDGKGEAADIVAIRVLGSVEVPEGIEVEFYHCKYSGRAVPGRRIADLYEVCGQAQKSTSWMTSEEKEMDLFTHLMRREARRSESGEPSRYEVGDTATLETIREISKVYRLKLRVFIVQPGVSKERISSAQCLLLGVTENYLSETYQLPLGVIASP